MLCGRSPWGLGGAVYLLVYLLVRARLFINVRSLMLSVGGQGILLKSCVSMLDCTGGLRIKAVVIYCKGGPKQWFLRSYYLI